MAYRFRDPTPVFDNLLGTKPAPGGKAYFYEIGTTDLKDTFREYDLTDPNTNPIILDSAGRFPYPVWMDGDYTYELKAADDSSIINPTDIRPEIAPGQAIPDPLGHDGEYLTVVGGLVTWSGPIWKLPDPTGSPGYMVVVDSSGSDYLLQQQPEPPEIPDPEIVAQDTAPYLFRAGVSDNTTKFIIQYGTGTAPATGDKGTSVPVTWGTPFAKIMHVDITTTIGAATPSGALVDNSVTGYTQGSPSTGATVNFNVSDDDTNSAWKISVPITFTYAAHGFIEVT